MALITAWEDVNTKLCRAIRPCIPKESMRALRMCFNSFRLECLSLLTFLAVSCVEAINLDPMEEMPVVVTCVLTTETTEQSLELFYAKRPSETGYVSIPDAKVVVRDDGSAGGAVHEFKWNGEKYVCTFAPAYDTRYLLEVTTADGTTLSAETTMPKHFSLLPQKFSDRHIAVLEDYSNPISGLWPNYLDRRVEYRQSLAYFFALETDAGISPYADELYAWISAGDRLSTDHKDADSFNLLPDNWNDLKSHPYFDRRGKYAPEYYQFFSAYPAYMKFIRIHQRPGFTGTVSEKYLGETENTDCLFYLNSDTTDDTVLTAEIENVDGIPEEILNEILKVWSRQKLFDYPAQNEYRVRFVSKDYDAFLKDLVEKNIIRAEELAVIYSTEPIHSNIVGGLGIFGAETVGSAPFYYKCGVFYEM